MSDLFTQSHEEEEEFAKLIPVSGFFKDYMEYTQFQESPGSFHFWVAATIISAVLQRRVWIDKGAYLVYPNLFTILIAPTGKCRKSTAMSMGTRLLTGNRWVNVIADKTTPEGMLESLVYGTHTVGMGQKNRTALTESCGLIKASELAVFLNKASYNQDMVTILTSLYDCPDEFPYVTRTKKALVLNHVAVSFLGASTADWLASALPKDAFGGGFMSRFIFIVKEESDRRITMVNYKMEEKAQELRRQLARIYSSANGAVKLTKDALEWYVEWYRNSRDDKLVDENLTGFMERKQDLILKLAMILAASHVYNVVDLTTIRQAHDLVTWTQERAFKTFKYVGMTAFGSLKERIVDFIRSQGGTVMRSAITRRFSRQLNRGITDLEAIEGIFNDTGEVDVVRNVPTPSGKLGTQYKLKESQE